MRTFKMSRPILPWMCALLVLPVLTLAAEPQFRTTGYYLTQSGYPVEVRAEEGLSEELVDAVITDWQQPDGVLKSGSAMSFKEYLASISTSEASRRQGLSLFAGRCTLSIFKSDPQRVFFECDN